jgi:hypothetical protein
MGTRQLTAMVRGRLIGSDSDGEGATQLERIDEAVWRDPLWAEVVAQTLASVAAPAAKLEPSA